MVNSQTTVDKITSLSSNIRYVALYRKDELVSFSRSDLQGASSSESDRYEEIFVNPTLLKLAGQRGNLDCGGLSFILVGYGNFHQLVLELPDGHASVWVELASNPLEYAEAILTICTTA